MNATKPSVDCDTGEVTWVELTDAEQAHRDELATEDVPSPDVIAALTGITEALAPLTPSSTSAQQRAALLGVRAAVDAALGQG